MYTFQSSNPMIIKTFIQEKTIQADLVDKTILAYINLLSTSRLWKRTQRAGVRHMGVSDKGQEEGKTSLQEVEEHLSGVWDSANLVNLSTEP